MCVLHVYSGNLYGGIETLLVTLARWRDAAPELEQHFALCFEGRLSRELEEAGATVHLLGAVRTRNPWSIFRTRRRLAQVIPEQQVGVVVCHAAWTQALFAKTARANSCRQVFWQHDALTGRHWIERWARRNVPDFIISNSRYSAGTLPVLYPQTPCEIVYAPVAAPSEMYSTKELRAVRAECQTSDTATVIIQVSRMETWKGHESHLRALAHLRDEPDWIAWFVGGPQRPHEERYFQELQDLAQQLGIAQRLRWLGQRSDVPRLLAAADIFCQPNTGPEPFGIVFIEALYAGLPVVATACGGALEIVDESCGVLTPPDDAQALADALQKLIAEPARRASYAAPAPARANVLCEPTAQMERVARLLNHQ